MRTFVSPAAIVLIVVALITGCVPSHDEAEHRMAAAVVAADAEIDGALAGYSSSGTKLVLSVKAYIPGAESMSPDALAAVVEAGLEAAWFASPDDPFVIYFGVVPTTMPDDADFSQQDVARFPDAAKLLDSTHGFPDGTFGFLGSELELRFGLRH